MNEMNDPSMPVQGSMLYVTEPEAPPAVDADSNRDERIWKPHVDAEHRDYAALIRQLPAGRDLKAYPSICVYKHYLKDKTTGVSDTVLCLKNIPGQRCPICDNVWGRWKEACKSQLGKEDPTAKWLITLADTKEWYTNVYIRADDNNPKYNGQVKLWRHSEKQHNALIEPMAENSVVNKQSAIAAIANRQNSSKGKKFYPYCPMTGHDYAIQVVWDTSKQFRGKNGSANYDGCFFDDNPTYLAAKVTTNPDGSQTVEPDEQAILAILDQCYDLNSLLAEIPTQQEALKRVLDFFDNVEKAKANMGQSVGSNPAYAIGGQGNYAYAGQPAQGYGAYPQQVRQNAPAQARIPNVPPQANVTTGNPNTIFGAAPAAPAAVPTIQPPQQPVQQPVHSSLSIQGAAQTVAAPAPQAGMVNPGLSVASQQAAVPHAAPRMAAPPVPQVSGDDDELPF